MERLMLFHVSFMTVWETTLLSQDTHIDCIDSHSVKLEVLELDFSPLQSF